MNRFALLATASYLALLAACGPGDPAWSVLLEEQPGALLSVTGTGPDDMWIVGADRQDGTGPTVMHFDGSAFTPHTIDGDSGDLWWSGRSPAGTIWMAGDNGRVFKHTPGGDFEALPAPEAVRLFGVLPFADDDVWAVGGDEFEGRAVVWHYDGTAWTQPEDLDPELLERRVIFKIWGTSSDDVWLVGEGGRVLHRTAEGWESIPVPTNGRLVTVHGNGDIVMSVGGFYDGLIVELEPGECTDVTPAGLGQLQGVFVAADGSAVAGGNSGAVWRRSTEGEWARDEDAPETDLSYHQIFQDGAGGVWGVGGFLEGAPLEKGLLTYFGNGIVGEPTGP